MVFASVGFAASVLGALDPKRLDVGLGASVTFGASVVDGLDWKSEEPKGDCAATGLVSKKLFLGGCDSFSLSDSPPSLPASSELAPVDGSFVDWPNLDVAVPFGANMEPAELAPELPNKELA